MDDKPDNDALLKFTSIILTALCGLMIILGVVVVVLIPVVLIGPGTLWQRLAESGFGSEQIPWLAVLLALIGAGFAIAFLFLRALRHLVATVSQGDPFVPINAARLRTMAWLVLAFQGLTLLATPLIVWFDSFPAKANVHHNEDGLSFGALVLALLLFVLARVFRRGTQMRDDLEGTI